MHPQMSWQSSQSSFHCFKGTLGTNKSLVQIRLWHAPPSSQGKGRAQRTLGLGRCEQTVRWVYGLNQRSVKYRDCGLRALLRSPPDIKYSGHRSLSRYMTFTAADMFDALLLHWHWSNAFQSGTAPDYFRIRALKTVPWNSLNPHTKFQKHFEFFLNSTALKKHVINTKTQMLCRWICNQYKKDCAVVNIHSYITYK